MYRSHLPSLTATFVFLLGCSSSGESASNDDAGQPASGRVDGSTSGTHPTDAGGHKGDATTTMQGSGDGGGNTGDAAPVTLCTTSGDASAVCTAQPNAGGAFLRFNQVGYREGDAKHLFLMSPTALAAGATYQVSDGSCTNLLTAPVGADKGSWNTAFPHVYDIDVSGIGCDGNYTVQVSDGSVTASAVIEVAAGPALYQPLLPNALFFYKAQQDGPNVDSTVLNRQPSHLKDETATVYSSPPYSTDGNDTLLADLSPVAGASTVDVSGGWFDAGDYLKFVETASYVVAVMLLSVRDHASLLSSTGVADFTTEAGYGIDWLLKMWNDSTQTLLYQVGIGNGSTALNIVGDHERQWQLPEVDDTLGEMPGDPEYYVEYRPALQVGGSKAPISPNLAGRLAADFGLCSQVFRATNSALADQCLLAGEHVFALADTTTYADASTSTPLLTAAPFDYYGETSWQEDLELGAAELSTAVTGAAGDTADLPETDPSYYLGQSASWAQAYISGPFDGGDTLNLYDTSALAHYELYNAMKAAGSPTNLAITQQGLLNDLKMQLNLGVTQAAMDPFGLGVQYAPNWPDLAPHALGFAVTAQLYAQISGDTEFSAFGTQQRDFVLGTNAWGSTFIIGAGTVFPDCPHHRVANLAGALDGTSPILLGAIPDGPGEPSSLSDLGLAGGANACPPAGGDVFAYANSTNATYQDTTADWPTVEPADDYTVLSVLLFAIQ